METDFQTLSKLTFLRHDDGRIRFKRRRSDTARDEEKVFCSRLDEEKNFSLENPHMRLINEVTIRRATKVSPDELMSFLSTSTRSMKSGLGETRNFYSLWMDFFKSVCGNFSSSRNLAFNSNGDNNPKEKKASVIRLYQSKMLFDKTRKTFCYLGFIYDHFTDLPFVFSLLLWESQGSDTRRRAKRQ